MVCADVGDITRRNHTEEWGIAIQRSHVPAHCQVPTLAWFATAQPGNPRRAQPRGRWRASCFEFGVEWLEGPFQHFHRLHSLPLPIYHSTFNSRPKVNAALCNDSAHVSQRYNVDRHAASRCSRQHSKGRHACAQGTGSPARHREQGPARIRTRHRAARHRDPRWEQRMQLRSPGRFNSRRRQRENKTGKNYIRSGSASGCGGQDGISA